MRTSKSLALMASALAGIVGLAAASPNAVAFTSFSADNTSASLLHRVVEARKYGYPDSRRFYNGGEFDQGYAEGGYPPVGSYYGGRSYGAPFGETSNDDTSYDPAATAYGPWYRTNGGTRPYAGGYDFDRYPPGSPGAQELRQRRFEFCESSPSRC